MVRKIALLQNSVCWVLPLRVIRSLLTPRPRPHECVFHHIYGHWTVPSQLCLIFFDWRVVLDKILTFSENLKWGAPLTKTIKQKQIPFYQTNVIWSKIYFNQGLPTLFLVLERGQKKKGGRVRLGISIWSGSYYFTFASYFQSLSIGKHNFFHPPKWKMHG